MESEIKKHLTALLEAMQLPVDTWISVSLIPKGEDWSNTHFDELVDELGGSVSRTVGYIREKDAIQEFRVQHADLIDCTHGLNATLSIHGPKSYVPIGTLEKVK